MLIKTIDKLWLLASDSHYSYFVFPIAHILLFVWYCYWSGAWDNWCRRDRLFFFFFLFVCCCCCCFFLFVCFFVVVVVVVCFFFVVFFFFVVLFFVVFFVCLFCFFRNKGKMPQRWHNTLYVKLHVTFVYRTHVNLKNIYFKTACTWRRASCLLKMKMNKINDNNKIIIKLVSLIVQSVHITRFTKALNIND